MNHLMSKLARSNAFFLTFWPYAERMDGENAACKLTHARKSINPTCNANRGDAQVCTASRKEGNKSYGYDAISAKILRAKTLIHHRRRIHSH